MPNILALLSILFNINTASCVPGEIIVYEDLSYKIIPSESAYACVDYLSETGVLWRVITLQGRVVTVEERAYGVGHPYPESIEYECSVFILPYKGDRYVSGVHVGADRHSPVWYGQEHESLIGS